MTYLNRTLLVLVIVLAAIVLWVHQRALPLGDDAYRPFDFDAEAVTGLEISNQYGTIRLRCDDLEWSVVQPFDYPADSLRVATLVANLESVRTSKVLPRGETPQQDLARAGLSSDSASFVIHASGKIWRGMVGRPPGLGTRARLVAAGRAGVFTLVSSMAACFFERPAWFRDPRALRCDPALISGVRIESDGRRLSVREQVAGHWVLVEPNEGPVEPEALDRLLDELLHLRAVWPETPPAWKVPDHDGRTALTAEWIDDGEHGEDTLILGTAVHSPGRPARRSVATDPFTVDAAAVERLLTLGADDLRDTVVVRVTDTPVESVTVHSPGRSVRTFLPARDGWAAQEPVPDVEAGRALGELLLGLEQESIGAHAVPQSDADRAGLFGSAQGRLVVKVAFRGRRGTTTVRFGQSEEGVIWVRRNDEQLLMGVSRSVFAPRIEALTKR